MKNQNTVYAPVFRGEPTQHPEIRVAYDDEHLYAAGWFYDTDPDGIRINSLYRDRWDGDDEPRWTRAPRATRSCSTIRRPADLL